MLCLKNSHNWCPLSPRSSVFSCKWYLRWCLGPFGGVTQCSWVSPMYTGGIHVIKHPFVFLVLIFYYRRVSAKNLERITRITPLVDPGSCIYTLILLVICWGLLLRLLIPWHLWSVSPKTEQPSGKAFRQSVQHWSVEVLSAGVIRTEGYVLGTDSSYYNYFIIIRVRFHVLQLLNCSFQLSSSKIHFAVIKSYLF